MDEIEENAPSARAALYGRLALALVLVLGIGAVLQSHGLGLGSFSEPGPGMWPFMLSVGVVVFTVIALIVEDGQYIEPFVRRSGIVLVAFAVLSVFILLFASFGVMLPSFIFVLVWLKGLNRESWSLSLALAVIAAAVTYLLFAQALGVIFPDDVVAGLWGGR